MHTDIPAGTAFVCKDRGSYKLWKVVEHAPRAQYPNEGPRAYSGVGRNLVPGDVVHLAVWKGDRLESRKTYTIQPGDVIWQSTGLLTEKNRPTAAQLAEQSRAFMESLSKGTFGDFMRGKFAAPPQPNLPVTEENFIFENRFTGKCPQWLKDAR